MGGAVALLIIGALGVAILYRFLQLDGFLIFGGLICLGVLYRTYQRNVPEFLAMFQASMTPAERFDQTIPDHGWSLEQIRHEISKHNLETVQTIVGIDLTASNRTQGENSFRVGTKRMPNLHSVGDKYENPYQYVIATLGRTLAQYDDDGKIPAFGFGDTKTKGSGVRNLDISSGMPFSTVEYQRFEGVLSAYTALVSSRDCVLSGPTTFAPLIERAIQITRQEGGYHILIIITDGEVTMVQETALALQKASNYPLSIIVVGVGDGPFDTMETFDDDMHSKRFDNVQFVSWKDHIGGKARLLSQAKRDDNFARDALQEIPRQMYCIKKLGLLSNCDKAPGAEEYHDCVQVLS